jgi:hypothetical protein
LVREWPGEFLMEELTIFFERRRRSGDVQRTCPVCVTR